MTCPECRKFVRVFSIGYKGTNIVRVNAECQTHGLVQPTDWTWEELFGEEEPSTPSRRPAHS